MTAEEAIKCTALLCWAACFEARDVPASDGFSLSQPKFFARCDAMLADVAAAQWRDYLAFHTIDAASEYLSKPFQDENFAFSCKTVNGQPEQRARWKRVLDAVNGGVGQALDRKSPRPNSSH